MEQPQHGFVYATTGEKYTTLARRAARNLLAVMPDAVIDLFTDQAVDDPAFAEIHALDRGSTRPKMEALRRSRFARTIYLNSDTIALATLADVFRLLERVDIAATHAQFRLTPPGGNTFAIPAAFPQLNSGLIGLSRSERSLRFLREWEAAVLDTGARHDQPALRDLLYRGDLRLAVLPPEYNFIRLVWLEAWDHTMGAPRLLHLGHLTRGDPGNPNKPFDPSAIIGPRLAGHLQALIAADPSLGGQKNRSVAAPVRSGNTTRLGLLLRALSLRARR